MKDDLVLGVFCLDIVKLWSRILNLLLLRKCHVVTEAAVVMVGFESSRA